MLDDACGNHTVPTTYFLQGNGIDRADTAGCNGKGWREDVCYTLNTIDRPAVFDARGNGDGSITTYSFQRTDELKESQVASTQSARQYKSPTDLVAAVYCRNGTENPDINGTPQAKPNGGVSYNLQNTVRTHQSVRRLTPLECERLQGFPDNWTYIPPQKPTESDIAFWREVWNEWCEIEGIRPKTDSQIKTWLAKDSPDNARYKAIGNSIALPPWRFVLGRIYEQGARTLGSLFDGIGGFPFVWLELGGRAVWASEVEPFPIKVTRSHFNITKQQLD